MLTPKQAAIYLGVFASSASAQYTATYLPSNAPDKSQNGQSGTNKCGTTSSQDSMCQNAYINNVDDFCLWAPPTPNSAIGDSERIEVAWCLKSGYGTRVMPQGTITGAHFVKTPDFVQVTGAGDLTKINVLKNDPNGGGELDPHGADGNGNPVGGLVFSNAYGTLQQMHEWTNFMSDTDFCFRACKPGNTQSAEAWCQHIYDVMGCEWNMPANYDAGVFEECDGDSGQPMGVYGSSTFHQGDGRTPAAHPIPASSNCKPMATLDYGAAGDALTAAPAPPTSTPASSGGTNSGSSSPSAPTTGSASPSPNGSSPSSKASPGGSSVTNPASAPTGSSSTSPSRASTTPSGAAMSVSGSLVGGLAGVYVLCATMVSVFAGFTLL